MMSLLFNTLSRFIIFFLPRSKCLLISWLQSPSAVILEPKNIKFVTVSSKVSFIRCVCAKLLQSYLTLFDAMDCSMPGSLSIMNSWSFLKLMSIESLMLSNHLILCHPLLLLPLIFPSIRVFSNESALS